MFDDYSLFVTDAHVFKDKHEIALKILALRQCDAEKMGVGRSTLKFIQDGIKNGEVINLHISAVKRLIETMISMILYYEIPFRGFVDFIDKVKIKFVKLII